MRNEKTETKKPEPPKGFNGHPTREAMEARNREFSEGVKTGVAEWVKAHPNGERPKVF